MARWLGTLRKAVNALLRFIKRLLINQPRNAYEGILFEAIFATQTTFREGLTRK